MNKRLLLLALLLSLGACQNLKVSQDYDVHRDFSGYRSWSWGSPALTFRPDDPRLKSDLTEFRVRTAVGEQLEQRGLRPPAAGQRADVEVRAFMIVDNRQSQVAFNDGPYMGPYWGGPRWGGAWGPSYTTVQNVDYQVATLQIDFYDTRDNRLIWRGSAAKVLDDDGATPAQRDAAIRESVKGILAQYPPH